jgi:hypothetical protein
MATVQITVPDALLPRLTAAMRARYPQYSALSDANAFRRVTSDFWRDQLAAHEGASAVDGTQNAFANAQAQARTDAAGIT